MSEKTNDSNENLKSDPLPWEKGEAAQAIMEMMGITGRKNENVLVTLRLLELTAESKVQAGDYQNVRVYQKFDGNGLLVHVPVYDPERLIDDAVGNVELLATVHKVLARQLDRVAVTIANERMDQQIVEADRKEARVRSHGKGVKPETNREVAL